MKKTIVLLACLWLPLGARAETCADGGTVYGELACTEQALAASKQELNALYRKLYAGTQYKHEFEQAQKAWLVYRDGQCNGYVAAEAAQAQGEGPGLIVADCLATLTRERVAYLKTLR